MASPELWPDIYRPFGPRRTNMSFKNESSSEDPHQITPSASPPEDSVGSPVWEDEPVEEVQPQPPVGDSTASDDVEVSSAGEDWSDVDQTDAASVPVQDEPAETAHVTVQMEADDDDPTPQDPPIEDTWSDEADEAETGAEPVMAAAPESAGEGDAADSGDSGESGGSAKWTLSPGAKRLLSIILAAAVFGVAGYLIAPRSAHSSPTEADASQLVQAQKKFQVAQSELRKLAQKVADADAELAELKSKLGEAVATETAATAKVAAVEKHIVSLSAQLQTAKTANGPMERKLAAAMKHADKCRAQADDAIKKGAELTKALQAATAKRDALAAERKKLLSREAELEKALASHIDQSSSMRRLLNALNMGPIPTGEAAIGPAEMPLTARELTRAIGNPTLTFQSSAGLEMRWAGEHSATSVDGVVTLIDGKPASRSALAGIAAVPSRVQRPPAAWRLSSKQTLHYADLVELFGKPEQLAGSGNRFMAWWSVGAWARQASATVVNGIVTKFDGKPVDPGALCTLVRHRPQAYRDGGKSLAVKGVWSSATACYTFAAENILPKRLKEESVQSARDGRHLATWELAPLSSVGTWAAWTDSPDLGGVTLRAALTLNWKDEDGAETTERRYVIISVSNDDLGNVTTTDFAWVSTGD